VGIAIGFSVMGPPWQGLGKSNEPQDTQLDAGDQGRVCTKYTGIGKEP
jgi:hypothetical protein